MLTSVWFGAVASSALIIGAGIGARFDPPAQLTRVLLAFASGALISALAFELFEDSFELGGPLRSGLGLLAGAAAFILVDSLLERRVRKGDSGARGAVGLALLAAVTLDGVPENLALGVTLVGGVSLSLLVAIFFSNLPEALAGSVSMRKGGMSPRAVMATWTLCGLFLAAAVVIGRFAASGLRPEVVALALAFAGGAVLASVADTLMPEAFEHGRPLNAFATAGGFFLSYVLSV
jgi:ZIP family zinc transporter